MLKQYIFLCGFLMAFSSNAFSSPFDSSPKENNKNPRLSSDMISSRDIERRLLRLEEEIEEARHNNRSRNFAEDNERSVNNEKSGIKIEGLNLDDQAVAEGYTFIGIINAKRIEYNSTKRRYRTIDLRREHANIRD